MESFPKWAAALAAVSGFAFAITVRPAIAAKPSAVCGNNKAEAGGACDGTELKGAPCQSIGFPKAGRSLVGFGGARPANHCVGHKRPREKGGDVL
jgi:hypothetical protein